jgi:hypothetical protein
LKLKGLNPYWKTDPSSPTYANYTFDYTTTPTIKCLSNRNITILSATSPVYNPNNATIVLEGSGITNLVVEMQNSSQTYPVAFDGIPGNSSNCTFTQKDGTINLSLKLTSKHVLKIGGNYKNQPPSPPSNIEPNSTHNTTPQITWNTAVDPEGQPITYYVNLYEGLDDNGMQLLANISTINTFYNISQPLDYFKTYFIKIYSMDTCSLFNCAYGRFKVVNTPPSAPEIAFDESSPGPNENITLRITTSSIDTDTDPVDKITYTYKWFKNHNLFLDPKMGPIVNCTATNLSINHEDTEVGDLFEVYVTAYDGINASNKVYASIKVINHPPKLNNSIEYIILDEDNVYYFSLDNVFSDSDSQELVISELSSDNLTITVFDNLTVEVKPKTDWYGMETIFFYANDSYSEIFDEVIITVNPVNDRPINNNFSFSVWEEDRNNITFTSNQASDVDDTNLIYQWDFGDGHMDENMVINHTYKRINLTKNYIVKLTITDGKLASECATQVVTIEAYFEPSIPDDNITKPDDNITVPDDNITKPDDNNTKPGDNDTKPDNNLTYDDADGDNLPDNWEIKYFGGINYYNGTHDPDNDGYTNIQEYHANTDPTNPISPPGTPDHDENVESPSNQGLNMVNITVVVVVIIIIVIVLSYLLLIKKKEKKSIVKEETDKVIEDSNK